MPLCRFFTLVASVLFAPKRNISMQTRCWYPYLITGPNANHWNLGFDMLLCYNENGGAYTRLSQLGWLSASHTTNIQLWHSGGFFLRMPHTEKATSIANKHRTAWYEQMSLWNIISEQVEGFSVGRTIHTLTFKLIVLDICREAGPQIRLQVPKICTVLCHGIWLLPTVVIETS